MDRNSKQYILDRISVDTCTGCWVWQLSTNPKTGYGQIGRKPYTAHRLSYLLWYGDTGNELLRHRCHNKACCNPDHLVEGTNQDNYEDSRQTHAAANTAKRGLPAKNAVPVVVDGVEYKSKVAAMQALSISWKTLHKLSAP